MLTFELLQMMVAFKFTIPLPPDAMGGILGFPADMLTFAVVVKPGAGFYGFLGATIISLTLSHVCIHYHRAVVVWGACLDQSIKEGNEPTERLMSHHFQGVPFYRWTKRGRIVVISLLCSTFVLVLSGSVTNVFSFEFFGASSFLPIRKFSLWSLAMAINTWTGGSSAEAFGILTIQVTFILFGMMVPLAHLVSLVVLWVMPLTLKNQNHLFVVTEVLNAWSALEVFVVSIICALLELPRFAQFVLGHKCDIVNDIVSAMDHNDPPVDVGHGEDKCFGN